MDDAYTRRFGPSWPVGVMVAVLWLMTVSPLMAEIQDVQKEIAKESQQYRAKHFPNGNLPPKHDWRTQRPLQRGEKIIPEVPGGVGYGYYFYNNALLWTNSTVADYYVVVPTFLGQSVFYLYLTSTCRSQLGTESLVEYDTINEASFWIYDWAQPEASRWQVQMDLPIAHPQYLTLRPDEFGITRQMIHVRNGTFYLGFSGGMFQWKNRVYLFNFNRGDWDLIYSHGYSTTNVTDNTYVSGDGNGFWGPIVETFDAYTNVNPVGFDLIRLFQDGNPNSSWLNSTNSYALMASPWQLLAQATNTSFTVAVSSTNIAHETNNVGTLCVTANTNTASFSLNPSAGIVSSNWVVTPWSNRWDKIVTALSPGIYTATFSPLPKLATPAQQMFAIVSNNITSVQAIYYITPDFQSVTAGGGMIVFSWNSMTGLVYQLQYKTNLSQAGWINLGGAMTASNAVMSATDTFNPDPQRFYRLLRQ